MNNKLKEALKNENIPVIINYEGVLFEARYDDERCSYKNDIEKKKTYYSKPLPFMRKIIKMIKGDIFVYSDITTRAEKKYKKKAIKSIYGIPSDHLIIGEKYKEDYIDIYLEDIYREYKAFVYIDSNVNKLTRLEVSFLDIHKCDPNKVQFYHCSSFWAFN